MSASNHPLLKEGVAKIGSCHTLAELEALRVDFLGKNGALTKELKQLGTIAPDERRTQGQVLNGVRETLEGLIAQKKAVFETQELAARLEAERVDVTLPCRPALQGKKHLFTQIFEDLSAYFRAKGFQIMSGPEVDDDFHNFGALNMPAHHPARQMQDTLYLKDAPGFLLRTHTSTMQSRTFETVGVPVRALSLGSVFRNDAVDATHTPLFHQIEVFVVEPGITVAHLKHFLLDLLSYLFKIDLCAAAEREEPLPVRLRPSFFPFTEPSLEVDCCCARTNGELKLDLSGNWLEILGCGMIHPNVFKNCGLSTFADGSPLQGFAAGLGVERIAMLKYGITDIRQFYEGDARWLSHYGAN
ncbi:phenylalanine--tRNA ligase alpha subunit [Alphaproteobacteria bacterium]|nr:phenylalanine--tRNA ligase alpha subunit [Alphaproteobacteria bacterium]GHS97257.1 phenylalanine--tRNA ligase alpha subunit [Alphaproteobacteria bacterium]